MKKILIMILSILVQISCSYSQEPSSTQTKSVKEVNINTNRYKISKSATGWTAIEPILGSGKVKADKVTVNEPVGIKTKDSKGLITAFEKTLGKARIEQMLPERILVIIFKVNAQTGLIKNISYHLRPNTVITLNEIDSLSTSLKKNVVFIFNKSDIKGHDEMTLTYPIGFRQILNGTMILH